LREIAGAVCGWRVTSRMICPVQWPIYHFPEARFLAQPLALIWIKGAAPDCGRLKKRLGETGGRDANCVSRKPAGARSKFFVSDAALEQIYRNVIAYSCSDFKHALHAVVFILFDNACLRVRANVFLIA
jgi:hypothetical protein